MIRVLLVIPTLDASGAEKQFTLLATGLPRERFEVQVVVLTRTGPYEEPIRRAGIPITILGKRLKADPIALGRLRKLVAEFRPHILHTWLFAANAYGRLVTKGPHAPQVIVSERCVDSWKSGWQLWLDRKLVTRTAALVANAESVKAFYRDVGVPEEKIRVIPNGVELPMHSPVDRERILEELGVPPNARIVASVGRLAKQKRVDVLVWAMQLLRQLTDNVYHVVIGDGPQRRYLEDLAKHFTCDHVTRFVGHRNDVSQLFPCFDVFWLASDFEGQSNSILEAMANGLPVIASDIPANRELIEDGKTGYLVRPGDSVAFAQWADRLLADPELSGRLGRAARDQVAARHSVNAMVNAYSQLYEEVAANASTGDS